MKNDTVIGLVQHACDGTRAENLDDSIDGIREAAARDADLVLLPELHLGPYFCQTEDNACFDLAEPIPGPTTEALAEIAAELEIVIIGSLFEKRAAGLYHNTAVVLERNGSLAGRYRKMHIPDDPGYYEKYYFTPGDIGFKPIETSVGKLGVLVCWDQWFPEAARLMTLSGADLLIYPTAIGWNPDDEQDEKDRQLEAWITIQRSHAIANGLPVISCNRIGFESGPAENGIEFWGNSFMAGPQGEILAHTNASERIVLTSRIDKKKCETTRQIWPYLRDRRIDEYSGLLKRFID
ncbi:MAG: carbon-nitrogen hydrolase [Pseudomonadota bacterium]